MLHITEDTPCTPPPCPAPLALTPHPLYDSLGQTTDLSTWLIVACSARQGYARSLSNKPLSGKNTHPPEGGLRSQGATLSPPAQDTGTHDAASLERLARLQDGLSIYLTRINSERWFTKISVYWGASTSKQRPTEAKGQVDSTQRLCKCQEVFPQICS